MKKHVKIPVQERVFFSALYMHIVLYVHVILHVHFIYMS